MEGFHWNIVTTVVKVKVNRMDVALIRQWKDLRYLCIGWIHGRKFKALLRVLYLEYFI